MSEEIDTKRGSIRAALSHRDLRFLLAGLGVSYVGDWMYGVALLAYVFQQTRSAAWLAAAGVLRLLPYLLFGTVGGVLADRYERRAVMMISDLARAVLMFVLAGLAFASGPVIVAIVIAMLSTVAATPYQPALGAMTPGLVGERDLAAANSAISVIENVGLALGPALGGILLYLGSPALAFAINGVTFFVSLACVAAVKERSQATAQSQKGSFRERLAGGFNAIKGSANISILVGVIVSSTFLYGQENVLLVLVSKRLLHTGTDGVGFLFAAIGVGGLLAAGLSNRLAQDPRPGRTLALTLVLSGAALIGVAFTSIPALAYAFLALDGAGAVILYVLSTTTLQRTVPQDVIARVFGIMMSLAIGGTLLGTAIAPVFVNLFNLRAALVLAGGMLPLLALVALPRLRSLNQEANEARVELAPRVQFLTKLSIFNGAPSQAVEALAGTLSEERVSSGVVVIRQGEPADDFFVVRSGRLNVLSAGEEGDAVRIVNVLEEGDSFGEIGLLEKIPRTATVQTTTDCDLYKISGDDFLEAVNRVPLISGARAGITGRLARTHPSYPATTPSTGWEA